MRVELLKATHFEEVSIRNMQSIIVLYQQYQRNNKSASMQTGFGTKAVMVLHSFRVLILIFVYRFLLCFYKLVLE